MVQGNPTVLGISLCFYKVLSGIGKRVSLFVNLFLLEATKGNKFVQRIPSQIYIIEPFFVFY